MSVFTWGSAGSKAETEVVQGSTIGTLKLKVSDEGNEVRDILFNEVAIDAANKEVRRSGPYPPDITRRPGWYEKDVVLDASLRTRVEVLLRGEGGAELLGPVTRYEVFGVRAPNAGGTGEVRVKDANTGPTVAETLSIEGATVTVANRVATFNLDGHYTTQTGLNGVLAGYYTKAESDGRYPIVAHTHPYLPLAGGVMSERLQVEKNTVDPDFRTGHVELRTTNGSAVAVGFHRSLLSAVTLRHGVTGALDLVDHNGAWAEYRGSSFWAAGNRFYGGDGARIELTNGAVQFLTSGSDALQGRFGSLFLGNDYAQAASVPAHGLYVAGAASVAALTTRDLLRVDASMRLANGGVIQAQRADGGVDPMFWPRWTDNNTYLNYGSGGYFYIRDNASNNRLTIGPAAAYFNSAVFVPGEHGMALKLGGAYEAAYSYMSSTPNLHLDSKAGQNIYLNFSSNRPVNVGTIDQNSYKLAVSGDAILHNNGWFRNASGEAGLYNEALNRHLYAGADGNGTGWQITGGTGATFLALRGAGQTSAIKGWLYADANGYGLLSSTRGWAVRTYAGGVQLYGDVVVPGQLVGQGNWGVVIGGSTVANRRVRVGEIHDDSGMFALDARNLRMTAGAGKEVRLSIEEVIRLRVHDGGVQMHGSVAVSDGNVAAADFVLT